MKKTSPPALFSPLRQAAIQKRAANIADESALFLFKEAAATIADRLDATNRRFDELVTLGNDYGGIADLLLASGKVGNWKTADDAGMAQGKNPESEPELLGLEENSASLVTSTFHLHRSNDLPGMLIQIRRALKPDGLLMACLPGERTLQELRVCLLEAESMLNATASLRVDPFVEVRQAGGLLQRAGFSLPVVDSELLTVRYSSLKDIVKDLRAMAAGSAFAQQQAFASRELFEAAERIYQERFADPDGRLRATVEIIYLSGWKPDPSQQQPLKPGSAIKNLKDVL